MSSPDFAGPPISDSSVFDPEYWKVPGMLPDAMPTVRDASRGQVVAATDTLMHVLPQFFAGNSSGMRLAPGVTMDMFDPEVWQHASHLFPGSVLLADQEMLCAKEAPATPLAVATMKEARPDAFDEMRLELSDRELLLADMVQRRDGSLEFKQRHGICLVGETDVYFRRTMLIHIARGRKTLVPLVLQEAGLDVTGQPHSLSIDSDILTTYSRTVRETWQHGNGLRLARSLYRMRSVEVLLAGSKAELPEQKTAFSWLRALQPTFSPTS